MLCNAQSPTSVGHARQDVRMQRYEGAKRVIIASHPSRLAFLSDQAQRRGMLGDADNGVGTGLR